MKSAQSQERLQKVVLAWELFSTIYPTDVECFEEVLKGSYPDGIECSECRSKKLQPTANRRAFRCTECGEKKWMTRGTFFEGKKCLRAWLGAIWMKDRRVRFNPRDLEKCAEIAYSTANMICKALKLVISEEMDEATLQSGAFLNLMTRRSKMTPRKKHPTAEQTEYEREETRKKSHGGQESRTAKKNGAAKAKRSTQEPKAQPQGSAGLDGLSDNEKKVFNNLSDNAISIDTLCRKTGMKAVDISQTLTMLELNGLAREMPGGRFEKIEIPSEQNNGSAEMQTLSMLTAQNKSKIARAIEFIEELYSGISRKYLQLYLADHWFFVDEKRWSEGSLLAACHKFRTVKYKEILEFDTQARVSVAA